MDEQLKGKSDALREAEAERDHAGEEARRLSDRKRKIMEKYATQSLCLSACPIRLLLGSDTCHIYMMLGSRRLPPVQLPWLADACSLSASSRTHCASCCKDRQHAAARAVRNLFLPQIAPAQQALISIICRAYAILRCCRGRRGRSHASRGFPACRNTRHAQHPASVPRTKSMLQAP
jgi:hypothetical protein